MKHQLKLFLISAICLWQIQHGFTQTTINLNAPDGGIKNYVADEIVTMFPGYHFIGNSSSQQMTAKTRGPVFENSGSQNMYSQQEFDNKTINTNLAVGTVAGAPSVSSTGAATYAIPIKIGKGTGGMEPSVSVVYNSQSGDGLLGKGWNLAGLSMISRVPRTIYHDGQTGGVNLDYNDRYSIDGNRLIVTTGTYGSASSIYGTEVESFMQITAKGTQGNGPEWFEVKTKEGLIIEFGRTSDSKLTGGSTAIFWRANKVTDSNNNFMEFEYINGGRDSRISKIKYTGNSVTNLSPYNEIQFFYKERLDKNSVFIAGSDINSNYLLDRISTFSAGHLVRSYTFKYGFNKASYLTEVKESVGSGEELNATVFHYSGNPSPFFKQSTFKITESGVFTSGDYNGDGITDLVHFTGGVKQIGNGNTTPVFYQDHLNLYTSNGSSFNLTHERGLPVNYYASNDFDIPKSVDRVSSDFNGDGLDDILFTDKEYRSSYQQHNNIEVLFSTGTGFYPHGYGVPSTVHNKGYNSLKCLQIGDFDGDGASDFITIYGRLNAGTNWEILDYEVHITFSKNNEYQRIKIQDWGAAQNLGSSTDLRVVDYNGDGKDDLLMVLGKNTIIYSLNSNKSSLSTLYYSGYPTKYHTFHHGDFNGDGKTDLLTSSNDNPSSWTMSYSKGVNGFTGTPFYFA